MYKVLILAYEYPPYVSIAVQRPFSWFKYLKNFGIEPVVVTRHWEADVKDAEDYVRPSQMQVKTIEELPEGTVIRVPFQPNFRDRLFLRYGATRFPILRRLLTLYYYVFIYFFDRSDRDHAIYEAAEAYVSENKVDLIIASGNPFILFKYAYRLSKKFKLPYILDYRDGWTTVWGVNKFSVMQQWALKNVLHRFELVYTDSASLITVASPTYIEKLRPILRNDNLTTIYNGYMPEELQGLEDIQQRKDRFTISYGGTIYPFQPLELFLDALSLFVAKYPEANPAVYFLASASMQGQAERILQYKPELHPYLIVTQRMSHRDALKCLLESNLLLLLANNRDLLLAAKVFDYIMVRRRILLVKNDHSILEQIMNQSGAGIACEDINDTFRELCAAYEEFKVKGHVTVQGSAVPSFERKHQAGILADWMKRIISKKNSGS